MSNDLKTCLRAIGALSDHLGDEAVCDEAAERMDALENILSTVLHEWVQSDEPMYHDAVKLLEGSAK